MLDDKDVFDNGTTGVWVPIFVGDFVFGAFSGIKQPVPQGHDDEGRSYPWWFFIELQNCTVSQRSFMAQRARPGFFKANVNVG